MRTNTAAYAAFLSVVALFLANAGVSFWNTRRVVENEDWVLHSRQVLDTIDALRANAAQAEAGQRGYLITGSAGYLQAYETAVTSVRAELQTLHQLTADNPAQQRRVEELRTPLQDRLDHLQRSIDVRRRQGFEAAREVVKTNEGALLTDEVADKADQLRNAEEDLLLTRTADSERSLRIKVVTNVVGTLLGIAVAGFAFVLIRRTLTRRQRAESEARTEASRQAVLAELRRLALSGTDLDTLMERTARLTADSLRVPLVGLFELLPDAQTLQLRAGCGWRDGAVGRVSVGIGPDSQAGFALAASRPALDGDHTTYRPVIVEDLRRDTRFSASPLLSEHGVVSSICVVVYDRPERPFGVLSAHATSRRAFADDEASFLRTIANLLAETLQRRRSEAALRDSEARFRALAESMPEIVWTSQPDGRCDYVNRRWRDFTGLSAEDAEGFGWTGALHEEDVERSKTLWMKSMQTGEPFECEYRFRTADGSYRWCMGRALPLRDEEGRIVKWFGNCMDIDAHLRMERTLQETDRRKNEFLAVLAHELRNPLAPIGVVAQLLKLPQLKPEQLKQAARMIDDQIKHMTRLIEDLSDASRIGQGKVRIRKERVELAAVVDQAVAIARPAIDAHGHRLTVDIAEPLLIDADPTRMAQVVANLLINASKYMDAGGHIALSAAREDDEIAIRVKDEGIGIAADQLDSVFHDFFQVELATSRSQGGLGIGLGLVRRLVELHGGTVAVFSEGPGRGSEFVVRLPAAAAAEEAAPRFHRVLVAEDHSTVAQSFAKLLTARGCEVNIARSGPETLEMAKQFRPDLVFVDIGLPGMDGFEVAKRLREEPTFSRTVLVALSGYGDEKQNEALGVGFDRYVVKPLRPETLKEILAGAAEPRTVL